MRVTEIREPGDFQRISLDMVADVYLHQDSAYSLEITAQENLMGEIQTDVSGETLEIRNTRCIRQAKTIRIDLYLPSFEGLEIKGSGDVYGLDAFSSDRLDIWVRGSGGIELTATAAQTSVEMEGSGNVVLDLDTDELQSSVLGSGDLHLHGSAGQHFSEVNGSGDIKAFELETQSTELTLRGSGNGEVQADSSLHVLIRGSGSVYYKGQPSLSIEVTGSGKIQDAN